MGSCLSAETRSPRRNTPMRVIRTRRNSKRRLVDSRSSSFDYYRGEEQLHRTPGRMFLNGSSDRASLFTQQGRKGTNQDAMVVWENYVSRKDTVFCGVFDGHGPYGHLVSKRVRDLLPVMLRTHWGANAKGDEALTEADSTRKGSFVLKKSPVDSVETGEDNAELFRILKESFLEACKAMDRELRVHSNIDCFCSGTTAVALVKQGCDVLIGNIGDSRAVMGTRDDNGALTAVQLTVDLKPNLPEEEARIRKCKGRVFALEDEPEVARVWLPHNDSPGLAMARAFGDFCLKDFGLISVPEISYKRVTDKDEFLVLATDGVWDALSNEEVVEIVGRCPSRSHAARAVVHSAARAWRTKYPTSKADDCAVVCLFLDSNEPVDASSSSFGTDLKDEKNNDDATVVEDDDDGGCNSNFAAAGLERSGTVRSITASNGEGGGVSRVNTMMNNVQRFEDHVQKTRGCNEI